jgi:hypothetical protein
MVSAAVRTTVRVEAQTMVGLEVVRMLGLEEVGEVELPAGAEDFLVFHGIFVGKTPLTTVARQSALVDQTILAENSHAHIIVRMSGK